MTRRLSRNGIPDADVAKYYRRRAEGGVGLIITEGTTIGRPAASNDASIPNFHEPRSLAGWANVVSEVHAAGGRIAPQLWHQGLARDAGTGPFPSTPSEGPTGIGGSSRSMTDNDIADTIEAFSTAARAAQSIGFDGVELHGAHGYLLDQFLWQGTNTRTDIFGGDAIERTRFAVEIVKGVRAAVGPNFPVFFRFSQWKLQDYSAKLSETPDQLDRLLSPIVLAGVTALHASTRRFWEPEFPGSDLNLAGWAKKLTGLPVVSVGSVGLAGGDFLDQLRGASQGAPVGNIEDLLRRMRYEEFDLIAIGRALLSDPDWPLKIRDGRVSELKPFDKTSLGALN
ncbi:NADH:flavin oxidoreductase [Rhizobium sp. Rhizsp82]|uniref:NADH:flavin oxidoreductase n=1 Tax=Rhizobium sp. Rhizsp82 TaxID=3243057 RepID=UPI0039B4E947